MKIFDNIGVSFLKDLFIIFALNLIFLVIADFFSLKRSFFNIDYFLFLFLFLFSFRVLGYIFIFITVFVEIALLTRQIFPFYRLDEIFYILKFLLLASNDYLIIFFLTFILIILSGYFYNNFFPKRNNLYFLFSIMALVFSFESLYRVYDYKYKNNFVNSNIKQFIELQDDGFVATVNEEPMDLLKLEYSVTSKDLYLEGNSNNQGVLFILVESLGATKNKKILEKILSPITEKKEFVNQIEIKEIEYKMPTVHAELRELCHSQPINYNLRDLKKGFEQCLPNIYKTKGYETTSIHGALSTMYDRKYWYTRAGFENNIFFETKKWKKRCYSFPGACDVEMVQEVENIFRKDQKQFVYWLTLNSHANYDRRDIFIDKFNCDAFNIVEKSQTCRNLKLQAQFFEILGNLIQVNEMSGVEVILVGDHTPPIFNQKEKEKYFDGNKVVAMKFKIKS